MNHPSTPLIGRARFWIVLPAVVLILADAILTLLSQPAGYWSESYVNRVERSPLGAAILASHPGWFAVFIAAWTGFVILLVARLREPWDRALALAVVVGHTAGIYGWQVERNYWSVIPTFLLVGVMTVLCWRTAETLES